MQLMPITIFAENDDGSLSDTLVKVLVNMLTVTHFQQLPSGHLAIHVMSGRVLVTNVAFEEFVDKQNTRSSILTPR
jgi:hypothetical protein